LSKKTTKKVDHRGQVTLGQSEEEPPSKKRTFDLKGGTAWPSEPRTDQRAENDCKGRRGQIELGYLKNSRKIG